jgi:hypothetical protein
MSQSGHPDSSTAYTPSTTADNSGRCNGWRFDRQRRLNGCRFNPRRSGWGRRFYRWRRRRLDRRTEARYLRRSPFSRIDVHLLIGSIWAWIFDVEGRQFGRVGRVAHPDARSVGKPVRRSRLRPIRVGNLRPVLRCPFVQVLKLLLGLNQFDVRTGPSGKTPSDPLDIRCRGAADFVPRSRLVGPLFPGSVDGLDTFVAVPDDGVSSPGG